MVGTIGAWNFLQKIASNVMDICTFHSYYSKEGDTS